MTVETISPVHLPVDELVDLVRRRNDGSLTATLQLPMERSGAEIRKNPIVFKNALTEVRERLAEEHPENERLRDALDALKILTDPVADFWQHQEAGLILAIEEDGTARAYLLPFSIKPFIHLGSRPHVIPLLRLIGGNRFHVLILDLKELRLLRSSRWTSVGIELESQLEQGKASVDLKVISRTAWEGRIARLYLRDGCRRFGTRNLRSGTMSLHGERQPGDDELVAELACAAAGTGSELICFPPEEPLPHDSPAAAVFRY